MINRFSTRVISIVMAMLMILSVFSGVTVLADREYAADLSINGTMVDFTNKPYSEYNMVFVPLEEVCGYLKLDLTAEGSTYTLKRMRNTVTMETDNMVINVNGKSEMLTSPLTNRDGVVYAPVELFSVCFNMPIEFSEDYRSVNVIPNVYSVYVDQEHAAAISAANPDKDTLATGDNDSDSLHYKPSEFPDLEKSTYYMLDFTDFADKAISKVTFTVKNAINSNLNPTLGFVRTALWEKATINYNNRPAEMSDQKIASQSLLTASGYKQGAKAWLDMSFDITTLAKNAVADGGVLSLKALGEPYKNQKGATTVQVYIKGVNTKEAPYAQITVNENYVFPAKQAETESVNDSKYSELQLLYSMGVFTEDDEFPLDMSEPVTRGEFLTYAMRLRGTDVPTGSTEQFFSDVPTDNGYFAVTSSAYALGYIAGWQGIAFRPYDEITIGEAITILGRMLNYNIYAEERGGFTPGYFAAAKYGDLYLGVNDNTSLVSFNLMVDLMENSLDAKMLDVVSYTSDGKAEYIFNENMTILTEYWDAQKIEGIVTANEYGSITPGANGEEGYIQIGGKRLQLNYEPYNNYLGYKVRGYYSKTEDVLLYIGTVVNGKVTEIDLADIEGLSDSANSVSFTYMKDNGNRASESFSKDATVIYNGKSVDRANITSALLSADGGKITLVGSDLVTITAYQTIVVAAAESEEGEEAIYDLYEDYAKALRLKNLDWTLTDKDGKKVDISTLKMYDVVSVAKSLDGQLVNAIVSTKKVEGKVSLVENSGTPDMVVTIGGIEYELRNITASEDFDGDVYWSENVKLGSEGTFLLNHEGHIAGFYTFRNENILGYIVDIQSSGKSALSNDLQAAIMVQGSEEFVTYDIADKVTIDGSKKDNPDDILEYFLVKDGAGNPTDEFNMQGIIFSVNDDKEINKIDTAYFDEEHEVDVQNTLQLRHETTGAELRYKGSGKLGDKFFWKLSGSLSVVMPTNAASYEDYMVVTSGIANDSKHKPEVYTVGNKTPNASIVVLKSYDPGSSAGDEFMVADRIVTAFDEEGYEVKKLYYHSAPGKINSVIVPDEVLPKLEQKPADAESDDPRNANVIGTVARGDIIRIGKDARGELAAIVEEYDYETKTFRNLMYGTNDFNAQDRFYGGYTIEIFEDTYIKVAPTIDGAETTHAWIQKSEIPTFYRYEVNNAGVELLNAKFSDIRPYENVPYAPTGILLKATYASVQGKAFLVEMSQPANTGIYKVQYGVTADVTNAGGTESFPAAVRANPGDLVTLAEFPTYLTREDYKVNEEKPWIVDGVEYAAGDTVAVNSEVVTVTPNWVYAPTVMLTIKPGEDVVEIVQNQQKPAEDRVYYPAENGVYKAVAVSEYIKEGYNLIGWTDGTNNYLIDEDIQLGTADITLTAVWRKVVWDGTAATEAPATTTIEGATYYQISNAAELAWFADQTKTDATINAILTADIYLNDFVTKDNSGNFVFDEEWYLTAANLTAAKKWNDFMITGSGILDGDGHAIYGLYTTGNYNGLYRTMKGTVKDVDILAGYLESTAGTTGSSTNYHGMVAAQMTRPTLIENVTVSGLIKPQADKYIHNAGGLVGKVAKTDNNGDSTNTAYNAVFRNCTSKVTITVEGGGTGIITSANPANYANSGVGGIVGNIERRGYIYDCTNEGDIYAPNMKWVGGIIGATKYNSSKLFGDILNKGDITGYTCVGQIVGQTCGVTLDGASKSDADLNADADMCQGSATATLQ